ncbi:Gamma-tubulin complex component [Aphis craccivora]|uniref:Gamma-tubulin complex component n=1 Tax=Aphis craccivora TaxID=307492 RepID=A0A6G0YVI6_APHCR|nr:Gamma-tubulin complex component [Aphis craccivora]
MSVIQPDEHKIIEFSNYLVDTYIKKQRVPRKAIRQRILFIENKIKQLNNNEITIKDYILNGVMNHN